MTVVRNRAIDRVRARRPRIDVDAADERSLLRTGPNPTWEAALARSSAADLRAAMADLPEEQRRAVELAYFEGYTYREVAEVTGVAPGTATGRLRLALAKLRDALAGSSGAPLPAADPGRPPRSGRPMICERVDEPPPPTPWAPSRRTRSERSASTLPRCRGRGSSRER